jgi:phenylacetate-CoA ligase
MAVYQAILVVDGYRKWITPQRLVALMRAGGRTAALFVTSGRAASFSRWESTRRQRPRLVQMVRPFSVLTPLPQLVQALNVFQPTVVTCYSTVLALLAEEQLVGRLQIHSILALIGAESLSPAERAQSKAAFPSCLVRDAYGASEFQGIALECDRGWLHVSSDWVMLEAGLCCKKKADLLKSGEKKKKRTSHDRATPIQMASF